MPEGVSPTPFKVTTGPLPASRKVHVPGDRHPELRVAMREIDLTPSSGEPAVRVYDTSGPYSDAQVEIDIAKGLPTPARRLDRRAWRRRALRRPRGAARG